MRGPGRDARCVLPDGRVVEYWDGGDLQGRPVVYHPGTPGSRILGRWGHEAAVAASVRLLSVSRAGYGSSTTSRVASLSAGGRDTAALAASLGLERYAVFGTSGGGPFAVATAVADPVRVAALGVVGGIGPWRLLDPPDKNAEDRALLALIDDGDIAGGWAGFHASAEAALSGMVGLDDDGRVDAFFAEFDGSLIRDEAYRALWAANLDLVINSPDGYVIDNIAWGGTWDVDPRDVVAPTLLWYGEHDDHCPPSTGRWYQERVAGSRLEILPGEGHLDVCDRHWPKVLAGLLGVWV
jgi:pimeloyl-ACP methyl ester carboxylesterase